MKESCSLAGMAFQQKCHSKSAFLLIIYRGSTIEGRKMTVDASSFDAQGPSDLESLAG